MRHSRKGLDTKMKLESLIEKATQFDEVTVAIAAAEDEDILEAVQAAISRELARFLLFGNKEKIEEILEERFPNIVGNERLKIVHTPTNQLATERAVKAVSLNEANVLMKGNVPTATLLKAVLNKDFGLRTGNVLSHVAVFEVPNFDRFIFVTDAAMNIAPDLGQKVQIIHNSVQIARRIGIERPLVAPIAAVEVVNPDMPATTDAALLTQMNRRGQIKDCLVDGPLALDNAISIAAAEHKGIESEVAGRADILFVPTIEVGNALYKSLTYFANAKVGAVIAGAKAPIVLTSRADSAESKLYSLAVAICSANHEIR
ncbi:phosphate butyryltransferase [Robertmurraya yapensis]|uniref:Phosphate butyryltransferase n=2 Tax=Bacillus yapensis TaxID=2492960 RepID=A0A431WJ69_9BACI|nr:phosphate butyryltransferase [Bacillus yapensis]RTR35465.1 phosphate butyryltransferase [Bacillus yapensis]TKS97974.1 phosphate butyryltransferase [Bacillus yapensis]